ncbi:type II toxin-antitoxin system death-on-curing family toxin [Candidatus Woesearchaeota archaeon]|nr:type II toxin-antitoxin system death-on-curing family toxin [Candidatus Woesearchaeota archaeon]
MVKIIYPTPEKIIEYNLLVLNLIKVKKADSPKVLSRNKITEAIEECKKIKGDIYNKAACLMESLVQKHPFASGNRRTAFIVTKDFLISNKAKFNIKDDPKYARVMVGVRVLCLISPLFSLLLGQIAYF